MMNSFRFITEQASIVIKNALTSYPGLKGGFRQEATENLHTSRITIFQLAERYGTRTPLSFTT
jgi:hypothetical protein